jgi:hypothetical protein
MRVARSRLHCNDYSTSHPDRKKEQESGCLCICQGAAQLHTRSAVGLCTQRKLSRLLRGKAPSARHEQSLCETARTLKEAVLDICR